MKNNSPGPAPQSGGFDWQCSNMRLSAIITRLCEENSRLCLPRWWGPGSRDQHWLIMTGFCPPGAVGDLTCPFVCHRNRDPILGLFPKHGNDGMTVEDEAKACSLLWCCTTRVMNTMTFCKPQFFTFKHKKKRLKFKRAIVTVQFKLGWRDWDAYVMVKL